VLDRIEEQRAAKQSAASAISETERSDGIITGSASESVYNGEIIPTVAELAALLGTLKLTDMRGMLGVTSLFSRHGFRNLDFAIQAETHEVLDPPWWEKDRVSLVEEARKDPSIPFLVKYSSLRTQARNAFSGFWAELETQKIPFTIMSQWRNFAKQKRLHKPGRVAAPPGHSYHNWNLARDVHLPRGNYAEVAKIAETFDLEWGGNWPKQYDPVHFHYTGAKGTNARGSGAWVRPWTAKMFIEGFGKAGYNIIEAI
ncbi:unnamed protein product, partial [marine sediment metagenome]